jgi:hypothetical protein
VVEATVDVRAQVERARERLAGDVQALAYQANLPRRVRERMDARIAAGRRRLSPQRRRALLREAVQDVRGHRRSEGARKLAVAARGPALVAAAIAGLGVIVARGSRRGAARPAAAETGHLHAGEVVGLLSRPAVGAIMHHRQAKKSGKSPGLKQFLAYTAIGAATSLATKWANDRIDRTAPPAR